MPERPVGEEIAIGGSIGVRALMKKRVPGPQPVIGLFRGAWLPCRFEEGTFTMLRLAIALSALMFQGVALAQSSLFSTPMERGERWEGVFPGKSPGFRVHWRIGRVPFADFRSDTGIAFGLGYHLNDHFYLGGDFIFNRPSYDAEFTGRRGRRR